jgi:hypothetical protein
MKMLIRLMILWSQSFETAGTTAAIDYLSAGSG